VSVPGIVLDPWAGSGTTGVACVHEDRRFLGIEQDAKWAVLADERINAAMEL
jgi:DNA modification methylase